MEINDKKLQRTKRIINFLISSVLALFLILLSNTIINDLDKTVEYPDRSDYSDQKTEKELENRTKIMYKKIEEIEESQSNIAKMISTAETNKEAEQQLFDNWIKTRSTLGSPSQDPEVLKRLAKLEEYQTIVRDWTTQSDSLSEKKDEIHKQINEISEQQYKLDLETQVKYGSAINSYDIRVFLIRLLFSAPILALGIFFFVRYRNHKFSPIFIGFSLFSIYVFFVGLIPYLPSYGGYIRYTVGVLLTIGLGYYAIKRLRDYSERKKAELKASSDERANNLEMNTAEKAFNNHICPSCGKDFILKPWEGISDSDLRQSKPMASNFCRYCGMQVIKKCTACQHANYAHLPHCVNCGQKLKE